MRRTFLSLATAGSLVCQQAAAQLHCMAPADRAAFDVQALRSEMMVLATGCSDDSQVQRLHYPLPAGTAGERAANGRLVQEEIRQARAERA